MNNRRVSPDKKERKCDPHEKRRSGDQSMRGERGFSSGGKQKAGETCFIGGRNSVLESLRAGQVKKVFIKSGKKDSRLLALAEEAENKSPERRVFRIESPLQRGEDIRAMQTALDLCGYPCGDADGICGRKTVAAVMEFIKNNMDKE